MKILVMLILFSSCSSYVPFGPRLNRGALLKQQCVQDFYDSGMNAKDAIESCEFVIERD